MPMSDDSCKGPFWPCDLGELEVNTSSSTNTEFKHEMSHSISGVWEGLEFDFLKTRRTYSAEWGASSSTNVERVIRVWPAQEGAAVCGESKITTSGTCSEECSIKTTTILYYDPFMKVILLEENSQKFSFTSNASPDLALFKEKWGQGKYVKFKIKGNPQAEGRQVFRLVSINDNIDKELHTVNYSFGPFPETSGSGTWGLYGNEIPMDSENYEDDVQMILLYPAPGKQAIPIDSGPPYGGDVIHYGFYDYNATEGGFLPSNLYLLDGGKDMFYPEWCRNMIADPVWRRLADRRCDLRWNTPRLPMEDSTISIPIPAYSQAPCGQMITSSLRGGFYSFTIKDRNDVIKTFNGIRAPKGAEYIDPNAFMDMPLKEHVTYAGMAFK